MKEVHRVNMINEFMKFVYDMCIFYINSSNNGENIAVGESVSGTKITREILDYFVELDKSNPDLVWDLIVQKVIGLNIMANAERALDTASMKNVVTTKLINAMEVIEKNNTPVKIK